MPSIMTVLWFGHEVLVTLASPLIRAFESKLAGLWPLILEIGI